MRHAPPLHGRRVVGSAEIADGGRTQVVEAVLQLGGYVGFSHESFWEENLLKGK
jgi:hypothetical protein